MKRRARARRHHHPPGGGGRRRGKRSDAAFSGGLTVGGRILVYAELDFARRRAQAAHLPSGSVITPNHLWSSSRSSPAGSKHVVRVVHILTSRATDHLTDSMRRPVRGFPVPRRCSVSGTAEAAAIWRGAFLMRAAPHGTPSLLLSKSPALTEVALAMVDRHASRAQACSRGGARGTDRASVRDSTLSGTPHRRWVRTRR